MNARHILLAICALIVVNASAPARAFELIKQEEAELPDDLLGNTRGPLPGPAIKIHSLTPTSSPFNLVVEFKPRVASASINIDSLNVWYSKRPLVDLRARIEDHIAQKGRSVVIRLKDAEAPVGKHQIVFRVEDTNGQFAIKPLDMEILSAR